MKMPYIVGPPVKLPTDFFGRARQTQQFFETLAGTQVQCVSVLGVRRAGKTSFLQYVSHPEVMATCLPDPQRYLMLYVDVSACKSSAEFYTRVYRKLLTALPRVPSGVDRAQSMTDVYDVESLLYEFGGRRVVLLMDEFDQLRTADFSADFMTELRALAGIWDFELAYVTASYWDLARLGRFVGLPPTSPFYNIFYPTPIYLSGLSPAELNDLVRIPAQRVGIEADDEDVAYVRHHAGTLPFFVQAMAAVWLTCKAQGKNPDTRDVSQRLVSEMWPFFEQWWRNFSDVERDVLAAVAQGKPIDRLTYRDLETNQAINLLKDYGVIAAAGDQLGLDSALFSQWLQEYTGRNKRMVSPNPVKVVRKTHERDEIRLTRHPDDDLAARHLKIIAETGRQFERIPTVYAPKSDEELREYIQAALQSGVGNSTAGLTVSSVGMSELLTRVNGINTFVADCMSWKGQKVLLQRVDRLLSYLTLSHSCAAVIVFVRNREFSLVVDAVAQALPYHSGYLGIKGRRSSSQSDYRFNLKGKPQDEVTVSILLFHLPG